LKLRDDSEQYEFLTNENISELTGELNYIKELLEASEAANKTLESENLTIKDDYEKIQILVGEMERSWDLDRSNFLQLESEWAIKEEEYKTSLRDMGELQKK
jgi:chromosome segregation ATPase